MTVHHRPLQRLNIDTPYGIALSFTDLFGNQLAWLTSEALCAQVDTEIFFVEKGGSTRSAKKVCRACPLVEACLEYAIAHEDHGVWGGYSARERWRLRKNQALKDTA